MISVLKSSIRRRKGEDKDENEGDPFDVIPLKSMKCAKETIEVHLGRRKIEKLINFEHFKNLEVLWINDNNLAKITGLDKNFRIKEIYAHNNRLKTLKGSISKMSHLQTLSVYNNEISDLDENLDFLSDFTYLEHIEFFNNPLAEEPFYKKKTIFYLKNLNLFDRHCKK